MKRVSISIFMIALFCLVMTAAVHAHGPVPVQIPNYINYQGKLLRYPRNPDRAPIPANGTHTMTFRIYDAEDAPIDSPLWEETHVDVNVEIGIFNVLLGEVNPLYLRFEQDYWLGLEVYPDYEMQPRQRIVSTGYSFMSQDSYSLNGYVSGEGNGLNADMVDGINASATPGANKLMALDSYGQFPNSVLKMGHNNGINADMLDGVHYTAISTDITSNTQKIDTHITTDKVTNDRGSYSGMSVGYASNAGSASNANYAINAGYANNAGSASSAGYASSAGNADSVDGKDFSAWRNCCQKCDYFGHWDLACIHWPANWSEESCKNFVCNRPNNPGHCSRYYFVTYYPNGKASGGNGIPCPGF